MLGQPSVIARLMGLEDAIVVPATATVPAAVMIQAEEDAMVNLLKPPSKLKQFKCSPLPHRGRINVEYYRYCLSKMKPRLKVRRSSSRGHRRRDHDRHPQEELLEKIKEDFRASWQQASMAPPPPEEDGNAAVVSASASGRSSSADRAGPGWVDGRYIQRIAQENLRREKMARHGYGHGGKIKLEEEDGINAVVVPLKKAEAAEQQQQQGGSEGSSAKDAESEEMSMEEADSHPAESEKFLGPSGAVVGGEHDHGRMSSMSENLGGALTRIAILRPIGTTRAAGDHREPAAFGMPPPSWKATRDGGMKEFLRAVKERLDNEMKAKTGARDVAPPTTTARRLWGSADQEQQTARDTARQIREAMVTKEDLGRRLSRLESFRVFRGDRGRRDAAGAASLSPEHRMLKRVRAKIEAMSPKKTRLSGSSSPLSTRAGRVWSSPPADASLSGIGSHDDDDDKEESGCRGDRQRLMTKLWKVQGAAHTAGTEADVVASPSPSPRALVRSFSAPASSRVSDGGPETSGEGADGKFSRSFSLLRETASSGLKQSFSLLLMHLTKKSPSSPQDSGDLTITAAQADFLAGLPPPSPVSPLEVHGRSPRHFSGGTLLPESSPRRSPKCSSELEASVVAGESPWRWRIDAAAESRDDDPDRAYVRELLIAAGLFDNDVDGGGGSWEDTSSVGSTDSIAVGSTDWMAGPMIMSNDVFDEVEDAYYYRRLRRRVDEDGAGEEEEDGYTDRRRLLFDLANEALHAVVDNGVSTSQRLRLRGRDLEDDVWRHVARAMTGDDDAPAPAKTVDGMVEREVGRTPWMALREDVCAVGRKVERAIFDDLVGEVVRQVFVRT